MTEAERIADLGAASLIARVLAAVARADEEGFVTFATDAELMIYAPKAYWGSFHSIGPRPPPFPTLFRPQWNPHATTLGVERSYHAGRGDSWDFLRHRFVADGINVVVFDGVNEVFVIARGVTDRWGALPLAARVSDVARTASLLFNPPWSVATWAPRTAAPEELQEMALSNARGESVLHPTDLRLDAGVWRGELFFLFYKVHSYQLAPRARDPQSWSNSNASTPRTQEPGPVQENP
jgi:hypothetical protein